MKDKRTTTHKGLKVPCGCCSVYQAGIYLIVYDLLHSQGLYSPFFDSLLIALHSWFLFLCLVPYNPIHIIHKVPSDKRVEDRRTPHAVILG